MRVSLQLSHNEKDIQFLNTEHGIIGFTTYTEEIWNELSKVEWKVNATEFLTNKKTYIYTNSSYFGKRKSLHQVVMILWYGDENLEDAYQKDFIVEHHDNNAFNCRISNLSFASNDLNLTKAHSFDKTQPKLTPQVAVTFYKDFTTQQYQIAVGFTELYYLSINGEPKAVERLHLVYDDDFRVVYTDANRIVVELLENKKIDFKLLSYTDFSYNEATFFKTENGEKISGVNFVKDNNGKTVIVVGDDAKGDFFFKSIPPNEDLYNKE